MMMTFRFVCFICSALLLSCQQASPPNGQVSPAGVSSDSTLAITYIANAGVLLQAGDDKVLIDALHRPYLNEYLSTPDTMIDQMMAGQPPFDSVDLLIVSHIHGDHFHSSTVAEYLARQPNVQLIGPPEAKDSLQAASADFAAIEKQIHTTPAYTPYDSSSLKIGNIQLDIFNMPHSGSEEKTVTQNIATLTTIGGRRILHTGDPGFEEKPVRAFRLQDKDIDIGLLPDWWVAYEKGAELVKKYVQPEFIIGIHVSPDWEVRNRRRAAELFPEAVLFTRPGDLVIR